VSSREGQKFPAANGGFFANRCADLRFSPPEIWDFREVA